jgi:holo-[acyl-carrier protein] synthase
MEIVGIGTHIVECVRIGRMIEEHGELFLQRVFTPHEIRQCREGKGPMEHFAGQWAAKEAVFHCLGMHPSGGISWTDVEVRKGAAGNYSVHVGGAAKDCAQSLHIADILVTIAHCRAYATAYAIAVRR